MEKLSYYVGIRKGAHVFIVLDATEIERLSAIAQQHNAEVTFVDHIEDPMVLAALHLGGIVHDDQSYNFVRTGEREWRKKRIAASTKPSKRPSEATAASLRRS